MSNSVEPTAPAQDDAQLIARCQQGEVAAFDQLVVRHQQLVFAVALRLLGNYDEGEDVSQDAFVRAYRAIGTFRGEAKFSTWLLSITTNLCRNRRRWWARRRRVIATSLDDPVEQEEGTTAHQVADPTPTPAGQLLSAEARQMLLAAVEALDEESRTVIVLRDIEGVAYEEIAQIIHCRLGTVKSRLNRARLKLKALLDGKF